MTPTLFKSLGNNVPHSVKHLLLGGEAFPNIQLPMRDTLKIYNIYGLTEMSVWQSMVEINEQLTSIPIFQQPNLLKETDISVSDGEIVIESKTRNCYVDEKRLCKVRTKDRGRQGEDGSIYFEGRLDLDVFKIHGRRLSIHEIQAKWTETFDAPSYCVLHNDKHLLGFVLTKVTRIRW